MFTVVTKKKFLGANYGFMVALPFANAELETPHFVSNPSAGISDLYVQPINLGWHLKQADVTAGYGFFAPTGRYTAGADNNTGLGMWGHELTLGTTVYFDKKKNWHAATLGALEFHTGKMDSVQHVGDLLTLEGGAGRSFLHGAAKAGLVYYAQWKITDDTLGLLPSLLVRGRNSTAAMGPELTFPLATKSTLYGLATFRYEWEVYSHTTTQGNALILTFTFPLKPIKLATVKH